MPPGRGPRGRFPGRRFHVAVSAKTSVAVTAILNSHVYRGPRPSETRPYPTRPSGNVHQENVFLNHVQLG